MVCMKRWLTEVREKFDFYVSVDISSGDEFYKILKQEFSEQSDVGVHMYFKSDLMKMFPALEQAQMRMVREQESDLFQAATFGSSWPLEEQRV